MQRELKEVLTLFKEKKRNLDIVKTPDVYITQKSNPTEVQNWLKEKGFSEKTQKRLNGMTASELFKLNRDTLEEYCGVEDGKRLASQITVQRNISGVRKYFVLKISVIKFKFFYKYSIKPHVRLNCCKYWQR